jgi:hypothetical protein
MESRRCRDARVRLGTASVPGTSGEEPVSTAPLCSEALVRRELREPRETAEARERAERAEAADVRLCADASRVSISALSSSAAAGPCSSSGSSSPAGVQLPRPGDDVAMEGA